MKHIIEILILVAIALSIGALAGCSPAGAPAEPHELLEERVAHERGLREEAELRAEGAASRVKFWEGACAVIFVAACLLFIAGTAIGSTGRKHGNS